MCIRDRTQILNACTLAPLSEAQKIDGLDANETTKRYMHHYNFPSFSVGETKPSRGPGRREIGHGALAERALVPVLPSEEEFPYAIRTVSETMESNGSTSQASICASTLSLMAAGVPIKRMVAGISCGLVTCCLLYTSHVRPDGDCLGSTLGLYNYLLASYPDIQAAVYLEEASSKFAYYMCIRDRSDTVQTDHPLRWLHVKCKRDEVPH